MLVCAAHSQHWKQLGERKSRESAGQEPPFGGKPHLSAAFLEAGSWVMIPGALVHTKPTLLFSAAVAD